MKIAILDDYQNIATSLADRDSLAAEVAVFSKPFTDAEDMVRGLAGFDVVVAMRERTRFPADVLERLTDLRLLVGIGPATGAIDLAAAHRLGITVCGTRYESYPTTEHARALILGAARNLVVEAELRSMKPSAILVNTSRGPIADEAALIDALREGAIRTAAIDVYDTEPLPADHPLRALPNAMLTRHVGYVSRDLYEIFYQDSVEDIAAFQAGSPLRLMK